MASNNARFALRTGIKPIPCDEMHYGKKSWQQAAGSWQRTEEKLAASSWQNAEEQAATGGELTAKRYASDAMRRAAWATDSYHDGLNYFTAEVAKVAALRRYHPTVLTTESAEIAEGL